jgi:single-strand DNA-binding protein
MAYLNHAVLMGNLTHDPELRYTPQGIPVATFTVAINFRDREGETTHGEFFRCEAWRGWAENLVKTARKGSLVLVEGRLRQETWKDRSSGEPRSRIKVQAYSAFHCQLAFTESRAAPPEAHDGASAIERRGQTARVASPLDAPEPVDGEDEEPSELPF